MKSIKLLASLLAAALCSTAGMAQTWDFSSVSTADQTNLAADATNWDHETGTNDRYKSKNNYTAEALKASSTELEFTKGLLFTATVADAIRVDVSGNRLALNKANTSIIIPGLAAGATVTVSGKTSSKTAARCLTATNLTSVSGSWGTTSLDAVTNVGTVTAAGDVTITCDGGFYIYSIAVTTSGTTDPSTPTETTYNSVAKNTAKNRHPQEQRRGGLRNRRHQEQRHPGRSSFKDRDHAHWLCQHPPGPEEGQRTASFRIPHYWLHLHPDW